MATSASARSPIEYVRADVPSFDAPAYRGHRYEALVPDTLELQERAALAVNGLVGPTDPTADHELYWLVSFLGDAPWMQHDNNDHVQSKFVEALPLMRLVSGSQQGAEVELAWMRVLLRMRGPDGLLYWPTGGRPWWKLNAFYRMPDLADSGEHYTAHHMVGRFLGAVALFYQRRRDQLWREVGEGIVRGLDGLAVHDGDVACFRSVMYGLAGKPPPGDHEPTPFEYCHAAWTIQGLAQFFRATGHEPALRLAGKLARFVRDRSGHFGPGGEFRPDEPGKPRTHFHQHTLALLAMAEYGRLAGDAGMLDFAGQGYAYGKEHGTPLVGHFPEWLGTPTLETSEVCQVADMIALGLKLSAWGLGDYWDDVDRWARNQFAESQLTRVDWLSGPAAAGLPRRPRDPAHAAYQTTEAVAERNLGAFAGWPDVNDWFIGHGPGIMHCCTGNGTRTLYYLWDNALHHDAGRLRVNLLLNRGSPWADVDSHLPYIGQVDVRVKQQLDLAVRLPEWVGHGDVKLQVGGVDRPIRFDGRYAGIGRVLPGDVATVSFPIFERTDTIQVEKRAFTVVRKGNDVVAIDPPGRYCPFYQRAHYRVPQTRWRRIERFVPDEALHW